MRLAAVTRCARPTLLGCGTVCHVEGRMDAQHYVAATRFHRCTASTAVVTAAQTSLMRTSQECSRSTEERPPTALSSTGPTKSTKPPTPSSVATRRFSAIWIRTCGCAIVHVGLRQLDGMRRGTSTLASNTYHLPSECFGSFWRHPEQSTERHKGNRAEELHMTRSACEQGRVDASTARCANALLPHNHASPPH